MSTAHEEAGTSPKRRRRMGTASVCVVVGARRRCLHLPTASCGCRNNLLLPSAALLCRHSVPSRVGPHLVGAAARRRGLLAQGSASLRCSPSAACGLTGLGWMCFSSAVAVVDAVALAVVWREAGELYPGEE